MPATMSNLIGTLAIAAFAATLIFYMYLVTSSQETSLAKEQLRNVSDNVAKIAVQLIAMANESNKQSYLQMTLELPLTVQNTGFWISIVSNSGGIYVNATTIVQPVLSVRSIIPINSTSVHITIVPTGSIDAHTTIQGKLYGGVEGSIIWAQRIGNVIYIGLGERT